MMIYIFRYGEVAVTRKAQRKKPERSNEDERHLTSRGRLWVKKVASLANENLGFEPEVIMSSPLPRARETAEVAKKVLGLKSEIIIEESLVGNGKVEGVYQALHKLKGVHSIALLTSAPRKEPGRRLDGRKGERFGSTLAQLHAFSVALCQDMVRAP